MRTLKVLVETYAIRKPLSCHRLLVTIGLSVHVITFSAVSLVIQKLVSPENDHFNLYLHTGTSICLIFLNNASLKLVVFAVQKMPLVF